MYTCALSPGSLRRMQLSNAYTLRRVYSSLRRYSPIVHKQSCKEESNQHLFSPAGMDLGLYWASYWSSAGLFFHLKGVVTHHRLVHGDNWVQHGERVAVDRGDKISAVPPHAAASGHQLEVWGPILQTSFQGPNPHEEQCEWWKCMTHRQ